MSRGQRAVQSSAWRRRVQGLACARQVQSKAGEGLAGLCWQFGCTQLQLLGSARAANSVSFFLSFFLSFFGVARPRHETLILRNYTPRHSATTIGLALQSLSFAKLDIVTLVVGLQSPVPPSRLWGCVSELPRSNFAQLNPVTLS